MTQLERITQGEAIEKAVELGCVATGMSYDAVLFSPAFEGYLDMVCENYNVVQDEPSTRPEISDSEDYHQMCESLRRGEG